MATKPENNYFSKPNFIAADLRLILNSTIRNGAWAW